MTPNKTTLRNTDKILAAFLWIFSCLALLFINYQLITGILLLLSAALFLLSNLTVWKTSRLHAAVLCLPPLLILIFEALWLILKLYPAFLIAQTVTLIFAVYLLVPSLCKIFHTGRRTFLSILHRLITGLLEAIVLLVTLLLLINAYTPNLLVSAFQMMHGVDNSYEAHRSSGQTVLEDNIVFTNDICYGETYPNSYLDLYVSEASSTQSHPTIFFVHGGAFTWGDKYTGDPNAVSDGFTDYAKTCVKEGYNFVSVNYALAPDYAYPTPIKQISEAILFLQKNADKYQLDMTNIVLAGGSAGGHIIGQLANIQTNPAYADTMKIQPVLNSGELKAMLLMSALYDNERYSKTKEPFTDYLFHLCGRAYFHTGLLDNNEAVIKSNVIANATSDFPSSFISDGNSMTFDAQAKDFHAKLDKLGVTNTFVYHEPDEIKLYHGYEMDGSATASDTIQKQMDFLNTIFNK